MKKVKILLVLSVLFIASTAINAQNIQTHYDFGRTMYKDHSTRALMTTTIENFSVDKWGSTFFFVDMDYTSKNILGAYWEIARELKFWDNPFSIHLEYNGGLTNKFSFNNAFLLGGTYTHNSADYSKGFTLSTMYKLIAGSSEPHSAQVTGTWYMHLNNGLYSFNGFADLWRENGKVVFISEPQFWVNLNKLKGVDKDFNLSVGTELEISSNLYQNKFFFIPTLGLKWTFK